MRDAIHVALDAALVQHAKIRNMALEDAAVECDGLCRGGNGAPCGKPQECAYCLAAINIRNLKTREVTREV